MLCIQRGNSGRRVHRRGSVFRRGDARPQDLFKFFKIFVIFTICPGGGEGQEAADGGPAGSTQEREDPDLPQVRRIC